MTRNLKAAIVMALIMCLVSGNLAFGAMLVCVHAGGGHGEDAVHFHYGQLPGQPCDEFPDGLSLTAGGEGWRHFSLAMEILNNSKPSLKRALGLLPAAEHPVFGSTANLPPMIRGERPFEDPSFVFLDPAFTPTTVLII